MSNILTSHSLSETWSVALAFALLPLLLLAVTGFAKISVVLSLLRNALGLSGVPSAAIVTVLSIVLSAYVMLPVGERIAALLPTRMPPAGSQRWVAWLSAAELPLADFLRRNADRREIELFDRLAKRSQASSAKPAASPEIWHLLPAFLLTELREAFQIGLFVLLPFVVIDLVLAVLLVALGMQTLPVAALALPLKLLLFVAADGWYLLARALVLGYR